MADKKKKTAAGPDSVKKVPVAVTADGIVMAPMRRFVARVFDYVLYLELLIWAMALAGVYMGSVQATLVPMLLSAVMMFCLEPLLLWKLGTTPGKALLGLSVARKNGERLSYSDGIARMDGVFHQGLGWFIPIWSLVRLWKSYRRAEDGKPQPWDKTAPVRQRGKLIRWTALFAAACVLMAALDTVILQYAELPGNKGDLTVEEFAENFTRQTSVWNIGFTQIMGKDGQWKDRENSQAGSSAAEGKREIPFQYTVEEGKLRAVTISASQEGGEEPYLKLPGSQIIVAVSAFVWAQKDVPLWGEERIDLLQEIVENGLGNYTLEQAGVTISCRTETEGFRIVDGKLEAVEGAEKYAASYTFTMELNN